jgi:hypothetical protein
MLRVNSHKRRFLSDHQMGRTTIKTIQPASRTGAELWQLLLVSIFFYGRASIQLSPNECL